MGQTGKRPSKKTLKIGDRLVVTADGGRHTDWSANMHVVPESVARGDDKWLDSRGNILVSRSRDLVPGDIIEVVKTVWRSPHGGAWVTVKLVDNTEWVTWQCNIRERTRFA